MVRDTGWFKSSRSAAASNSCVEVRIVSGHAVGVRDSKNAGGGVLWVELGAWSCFLGRVGRPVS